MARVHRRRRGRFALRAGLLIAVLAWLGIRVGQGLAPADVEEARPPAPDAPDAARPEVDPDATLAAGNSRSADRPELGGETEDPAADARRAAAADHLWGALRAISGEDLERAFAAAERARRLEPDLDAEQQERLSTAVGVLERRAAARFATGLDRIVAGDVLGGVALLAPGATTGQARMRAAFEQALAERDVQVPNASGAVALDAPAPLERGTAVRVDLDGVITDGQVIGERDGAVTVRAQAAAGFRFPSVPRRHVQPVGTDPELALDQAVVALRAGERLLAAAWLLRARTLGADPARLAELRSLVGR